MSADKYVGSALNTTGTPPDGGILLLGVRKDTATDLTGAAGNVGPLQFDSSGNLRVNPSGASATVAPSQGSLTDRSGTVTSGGTAQTLAAANTSRKYLLVQNQSTTALWIDFGATAAATQPALRLNAGDSFVMEGLFVSTQAVSIFGATTSQAFCAKEG